jgi:hypothetical protein
MSDEPRRPYAETSRGSAAERPNQLSADFDAYLRTLPREDLSAAENERILHEAWRVHKLGGVPLAILERSTGALQVGWKNGDPSKMFGPKASSRIEDFLPALEACRLNEVDWSALADLLVKLIPDAKHGYDVGNEFYDSVAASNRALNRLVQAMKGKKRPKKLARFLEKVADDRTRQRRETWASLAIQVLEVQRHCRKRKRDPRQVLFPEFKRILEDSAHRQGKETNIAEVARQANDLYIVLSKFVEKHRTKNQIRRALGLLARPDRVLAKKTPK